MRQVSGTACVADIDFFAWRLLAYPGRAPTTYAPEHGRIVSDTPNTAVPLASRVRSLRGNNGPAPSVIPGECSADPKSSRRMDPRPCFRGGDGKSIFSCFSWFIPHPIHLQPRNLPPPAPADAAAGQGLPSAPDLSAHGARCDSLPANHSNPHGFIVRGFESQNRSRPNSTQNLFIRRRGWDSNPRTRQRVTRFRVEPVRPLWHLSVR